MKVHENHHYSYDCALDSLCIRQYWLPIMSGRHQSEITTASLHHNNGSEIENRIKLSASAWLQKSLIKAQCSAELLYDSGRYSVNEIPLAQPSTCQRDGKCFRKLCSRGPFVSHTCKCASLDLDSTRSVWQCGVWNLTFPIAQSACVFSVSLGRWTMSEEKKGLTDSSDNTFQLAASTCAQSRVS